MEQVKERQKTATKLEEGEVKTQTSNALHKVLLSLGLAAAGSFVLSSLSEDKEEALRLKASEYHINKYIRKGNFFDTANEYDFCGWSSHVDPEGDEDYPNFGINIDVDLLTEEGDTFDAEITIVVDSIKQRTVLHIPVTINTEESSIILGVDLPIKQQVHTCVWDDEDLENDIDKYLEFAGVDLSSYGLDIIKSHIIDTLQCITDDYLSFEEDDLPSHEEIDYPF